MDDIYCTRTIYSMKVNKNKTIIMGSTYGKEQIFNETENFNDVM